METEAEFPETDAETQPKPAVDTENGAGVQPKPAIEMEWELSMPLASVLKSIFQNSGEAAVSDIVEGVLNRRGAPGALAGEQTALRAAMDELEEDPSDEAGKVLNIIFRCFDAVELVRERAFPSKSSIKPTDETPGSLTNMTFEAIAQAVPRDDEDDKWGECDINGDPWKARETDDQPKRPDCDD